MGCWGGGGIGWGEGGWRGCLLRAGGAMGIGDNGRYRRRVRNSLEGGNLNVEAAAGLSEIAWVEVSRSVASEEGVAESRRRRQMVARAGFFLLVD